MGSYNNNTVPVRPPFREIEIRLTWTDGYGTGGKTFESVQKLAAFLTDNPEFGKAVGYIAKVNKKH